ncbi:HAD-IC family P-type ATPase [Vogesella indigofera]|uniref:HAD-IC family P-type ATPase n=1 Tax=Vogesella indigofera TaxID=45465 RepID=A0ABT5I8P3_VOGIN|nr:HAD-IC family P-type ATPase [Vogesella indigofera]MDC7692353.1 HAD-IC family P-type ATPase [Vogesella indigofera]
MKPATPAPHWHAEDTAQVMQHWQSSDDGLSQHAAAERLQRYGRNSLPQPAAKSLWLRFVLQFHNLLIYVLLAAALGTLLLADYVDSAVIFGVVLINAVIGTIQEGRAESALAAIRNMLALQATVIRDGERHDVDASTLVPGDIVLLQSGDKVPADLRLLDGRSLRLDEAALTGESLPVSKDFAALPAATPLAERRNMAYAGTLVSYGQARGLVIATGRDTELGRINAMLDEVGDNVTPLMRQLDQFARWLTGATLLVASITLLLGVYWRGHSWPDMFMAGVGLAVAAIPEGLPAIVTITLAIGVERMARQRAIMRKLPAVETLGAVTVICSDKTGTLTCNEMTAGRIVTRDRQLRVSGVGYAPEGGLFHDDAPLHYGQHAPLDALLRAAALCNDASLQHVAGQWQLSGDPTEGALLTLAHKAQLPLASLQHSLPRQDAIPFESEHRFMATLHHDHDGHRLILLKGAPEVLLARASHQQLEHGIAGLELAFWQQQAQQLAGDGYRVLAIAERRQAHCSSELDFADTEGQLLLLGLVGMIDPPREEAARAVALCQSAGIRIKMITGDHAGTAAAIGGRLGIGDGLRALSGSDIDALDDAALALAVRDIDVFARASPEHKLRLIAALKHNGEVVAMTGDGVNDAPALKQADVGVAMGGKGTEAAKEAAEMVITDDNFATLALAVREGRTVYDNLKKAILFILPTNVGQAAIIIAAILFGVALPISPVQILWVNMVSAVTLALAFAFEPTEHGVMRRPPRPPQAGLIDALFVWRLAFVGALMVALPFALYLWALDGGHSQALASTLAVNSMVAIEIAYLFNSRHQHTSALTLRVLGGNRIALWCVAILLLLQLAFSYLPWLHTLFGTAPPALSHWGLIAASGVLAFLLIEAEKALLRR